MRELVDSAVTAGWKPATVYAAAAALVERQKAAFDEDPDPADDERPAGFLPPFTDPAFSSRPATPAVRPDAPEYVAPPKDTEFAGHPDFSEDAAENKRPR